MCERRLSKKKSLEIFTDKAHQEWKVPQKIKQLPGCRAQLQVPSWGVQCSLHWIIQLSTEASLSEGKSCQHFHPSLQCSLIKTIIKVLGDRRKHLFSCNNPTSINSCIIAWMRPAWFGPKLSLIHTCSCSNFLKLLFKMQSTLFT